MGNPYNAFREISLIVNIPESEIRKICFRNCMTGITTLDVVTVHKVRCMANLGCALCEHKKICAARPELRTILHLIGQVNETPLKRVEGYRDGL